MDDERAEEIARALAVIMLAATYACIGHLTVRIIEYKEANPGVAPVGWAPPRVEDLDLQGLLLDSLEIAVATVVAMGTAVVLRELMWRRGLKDWE